MRVFLIDRVIREEGFDVYTYIPRTLYPRRSSIGFSDIPRDTHVLPKLLSYEEYCRRDRW
jgi:hypothetical protein